MVLCTKYFGSKNDCVLARTVLWYLVFVGFAVNYMMRINLNIAIVSMVRPRPSNNLTLTSECISTKIILNNFTLEDQDILNLTESKFNIFDVNNSYLDVEERESDDDGLFDWDEKQQSNILGAFYWLHWLTQIPGGLLASKYGTKIVFGLANFTGVLCCFLIPTAAYMGQFYLILIRTLQGLLTGFAWPAMHNMTARWIPPNERSKFVTAYLGSSVGAALTYPICGFIIDKWGWELAFYACGAVGTLWYAAWWLLVYDNPVQHPRISDAEKRHILDSLGQSYTKEKAPTPWRHVLTSLPVWMNILAQWGGIWGLFTLMTHTPTYFKFIHGLNIRATGILSGLPHIMRMVWAYICSQIGDFLLRTNKMSRTNVRKLATACCTIGQGIFMLALAYSGCNSVLAVVCLSTSIALNGAVSTGPLASIVDISPNYASVVLGIVNTVVAMVGFLTPGVVGYLTFQQQTAEQWQKVFWIATFMLFVSGIMYLTFSKSELQPWNSPENMMIATKEDLITELVSIKSAKEKNDTEADSAKDGYKIVPKIDSE